MIMRNKKGGGGRGKELDVTRLETDARHRYKKKELAKCIQPDEGGDEDIPNQ